MVKSTLLRQRDWNAYGQQVMRETRDELQAKQICGLELRALQQEVEAETVPLQAKSDDAQWRLQALGAQLYNRHHPVSDLRMVALSVTVVVVSFALIAVTVASAVSHTVTFRLFGWSLALSTILGLTLTALLAGAGYLAFERQLAKQGLIQAVCVFGSFGLCLWGVLELAQARAAMTQVAASAPRTEQSYVDGEPTSALDDEFPPAGPSQQDVHDRISSGIMKIMLACDLVIGLLLAIAIDIRANDDFASWRHLKRLRAERLQLQAALAALAAVYPIAARNCLAGIVRGRQFIGSASSPYFKLIALILLGALAWPRLGAAQVQPQRHETILVDVSGSIAQRGQGPSQLEAYLAGVQKLLATEPEASRVWVQMITTDSFGGAQPILSGWTPLVTGVFTETLDNARRQLLRRFQTSAADLAPAAAGTDIIGALWRTKTLLDSAGDRRVPSELFIFSDMLAETPGFAMPALLASGAQRMFEMVNTNGLIVPLSRVRVHVYGASTAALSPKAWDTIREFWTMYFRAANAELVTYSAETVLNR